MAFDAAERFGRLAAFSARVVKRAAAEEKETSIPLRKGSDSQSRRQGHPSKLS